MKPVRALQRSRIRLLREVFRLASVLREPERGPIEAAQMGQGLGIEGCSRAALRSSTQTDLVRFLHGSVFIPAIDPNAHNEPHRTDPIRRGAVNVSTLSNTSDVRLFARSAMTCD